MGTTYREAQHPRGADGRWVAKGDGVAAARDRLKIGMSTGSMGLLWSAAQGHTASRALLAGVLALGVAYGAARYRKGLGRAAVGAFKGARWGWQKARPLFGAPKRRKNAGRPRLWHPVARLRWSADRTKRRWKRKLTPKMVKRYRKNRDAWRRWRESRR